MKAYAIAAVVISLTVSAACAATYRASYVDDSGAYATPSVFNAYKDGVAWTAGNVGFANVSTASGPNLPGHVLVVLSNVTTPGAYMVVAQDRAGFWHRLELDYEPQQDMSAADVWASPVRTLTDPDSYKADTSGLATAADVSAAHSATDALVVGIDDNPWDDAVRTVTGGSVDAAGSVTGPVTLAMSSYTGIDARLTSTHGAGLWSASGSVNVVPFRGSVSYETANFGSDVHIVRGDSAAIPYSVGTDITGREVWFGAKANPADEAYAVGPIDITAYVADPAAGTGLIELSTSHTDITSRRYFAEIELRGPGEVSTPLRFYLWIDPDVIR